MAVSHLKESIFIFIFFNESRICFGGERESGFLFYYILLDFILLF